jgi:hypothetical protein
MESMPIVHKLLVLFSLTCLVGCTASSPNYKTVSLPSGKQIKVIGIGRINFSQGPPAMMLKYQTDLKVTDKGTLRSEVDEIWPVFRNDVEQARLRTAIISANEIPHGILIKSGQSYNFVYEKSADGTWRSLDDGRRSTQ